MRAAATRTRRPLSTSAATALDRSQHDRRASSPSERSRPGHAQRLRTGDHSLRSAAALPHGKPVSSEIGLASWYGPPYANRKAADGSVYDQNAMTAAHRTLPMGSIVRVTNLANDQSVVVRITDRGPFVGDRIIDLSLAAAKETGVYRAGVARVRVEAYAPPVRPGVDPAGKWCVQIGAFPDEASAVKLKNSLMRRYSTAKVIEFAGPTGHWVRINPLKNDRQATASQDREEHPRPHPRRPALHRPPQLGILRKSPGFAENLFTSPCFERAGLQSRQKA